MATCASSLSRPSSQTWPPAFQHVLAAYSQGSPDSTVPSGNSVGWNSSSCSLGIRFGSIPTPAPKSDEYCLDRGRHRFTHVGYYTLPLQLASLGPLLGS